MGFTLVLESRADISAGERSEWPLHLQKRSQAQATPAVVEITSNPTTTTDTVRLQTPRPATESKHATSRTYSPFAPLEAFSGYLSYPQTRVSLVTTPPGFASKVQGNQYTFQGVGFPHIETNDRTDKHRYKPYTRLMLSTDKHDPTGRGLPVANVACVGGNVAKLAKRAQRYDAMLFDIAMEHTISASLIKAIITVESCFYPNATSPTGASGLMQLMPGTADLMGVEDAYDPEQNIRGGIRYLKLLRKQFKSLELALAAYNAGPGNVTRFNGIPPFPETRNYVERVMRNYRSYAETNRHRASTSVALSTPSEER